MKKVKITKVTDNIPNESIIKESYIFEGELISTIELGFPVYAESETRYFRTTPVIEIVNKNTFKTKNSTYLIEEIS